MNEFAQKKQLVISRWIFIVVYLIIIILCAWQSDDAYHGYAMSKNLADGYGLVYNIGERVNASTCPLYTILIAIAYKITGEMYFTSLAVGIGLSIAAVGLVFWKFCKTFWDVIITFLLLCSLSFVSFTTSGLENSLLYLLCTLFVLVVFSKETYSSKDLFVLAFLSGLIATTRMDNILIYLPILVWIFFIHPKNISMLRSTLIGFAGVLPFILWELFSLFYYGFPFPNTVYAKLGTGIVLGDYIKKGIEYFIKTGSCDLAVVMVPIFAVLAVFVIKNLKYRLIAAGIFLYMLYILRIGGDFMLGRHFTVIFLMSICILLKCYNEIKPKYSYLWRSGFSIACICFMMYSSAVGYLIPRDFIWGGRYGSDVADERAWYYPNTGLPHNIISLVTNGTLSVPNTWSFEEVDNLRAQGITRAIVSWAPGIIKFYNPDLYLGDAYCLGDPLLARLPAIPKVGDNWRVGHTSRALPQGYAESIKNDTNEIINPKLRQYYDVIRLITRGELFDLDRLKAIVDINLGKYDYLLDSETNANLRYFYDSGLSTANGAYDSEGNFVTDGTEGFAAWGPYSSVPEGTYQFTLNYEVVGNPDQLEQVGEFDVAVNAQRIAVVPVEAGKQTVTVEVNFDGYMQTDQLEYRTYVFSGVQLKLKSIEINEVDSKNK